MSETLYEGDIVDSEVTGESALTLHDPVAGHMVDMSQPLTLDEARILTDRIRSTADILWVLLARAHAGKAWEALGYSSFADYAKEEFDISRSRAYQLLDQARVVQAIEAAAPEGTELEISEAAARDLKSVLGEVVPEVEARTVGLPASEAADVVEEIVDDYRDRVREQREQREQDALDAENQYGGGGYPGDGTGCYGGGEYTPPPIYADDDDLDPAVIRRNVQACYDLYSSVSALKAMPEIQDIIDTIPPDRRTQVSDALNPAVEWLTQFRDTWFAQDWDGDADADDDF